MFISEGLEWLKIFFIKYIYVIFSKKLNVMYSILMGFYTPLIIPLMGMILIYFESGNVVTIFSQTSKTHVKFSPNINQKSKCTIKLDNDQNNIWIMLTYIFTLPEDNSCLARIIILVVSNFLEAILNIRITCYCFVTKHPTTTFHRTIIIFIKYNNTNVII